MEPEDLDPSLDERELCARCGRETAVDSDRIFAFGAGSALCWECAIECGGRYDVERDVWDVAPDLEGLPDEAYGAAPHEVRRRR